ncbi:MAG: ComF family protein [Bacteroidota bacterium]
MIKNLKYLLIDPSCYSCDNILTSQEEFICFSCLSRLVETNFHHTPTENELYYRLAGRVSLAGATSLYYFDKEGTLQEIIQQIKYHSAPHLGEFLGKKLAKTVSESSFLSGKEVVLPIPLHWKKRFHRGYNQTEFIAKGFAQQANLKMNPHILKRRKNTQTQTKLSVLSRWNNVAKAFTVSQQSPPSVVLIDDVITTGSTLEACIRALQSSSHPPKNIKIASIGMARNS